MENKQQKDNGQAKALRKAKKKAAIAKYKE